MHLVFHLLLFALGSGRGGNGLSTLGQDGHVLCGLGFDLGDTSFTAYVYTLAFYVRVEGFVDLTAHNGTRRLGLESLGFGVSPVFGRLHGLRESNNEASGHNYCHYHSHQAIHVPSPLNKQSQVRIVDIIPNSPFMSNLFVPDVRGMFNGFFE
jgi:hypothetical protein